MQLSFIFSPIIVVNKIKRISLPSPYPRCEISCPKNLVKIPASCMVPPTHLRSFRPLGQDPSFCQWTETWVLPTLPFPALRPFFLFAHILTSCHLSLFTRLTTVSINCIDSHTSKNNRDAVTIQGGWELLPSLVGTLAKFFVFCFFVYQDSQSQRQHSTCPCQR